MAGVPTSSVSAAAPRPVGSMFMNRPSSGDATISGSTLPVQCARHFTSTVSASMWRSSARMMQVERAVLAVGLEQPVEPEQARQQRADPQDRRPDPRQQVEIRPDAEGDRRDDGEEEQDARQRPAPGAHGQTQVAEIER